MNWLELTDDEQITVLNDIDPDWRQRFYSRDDDGFTSYCHSRAIAFYKPTSEQIREALGETE